MDSESGWPPLMTGLTPVICDSNLSILDDYDCEIG